MNNQHTIALVLKSKEARYLQENRLAQHNFAYVTVALNIPVRRHFNHKTQTFFQQIAVPELEKVLKSAKIDYQVTAFQLDSAGWYSLFAIIHDVDLIALKLQLIALERKNSTFQVIDYDVFTNQQTKISRQTLHQPPRKCYLCPNPAQICHRLQMHNHRAINKKIYQLMQMGEKPKR